MLDIVVKTFDEEKRYTLGVVYEPERDDAHGDFAKAETIEHAAWGFLERMQQCAKACGEVVKAVELAGPCKVCGAQGDEHTEPHVYEGSEVTLDLTDVYDLVTKSADDGLDDEHLQTAEDVGTIVESYVAPVDMLVGEERITKGTWLLGVVWTPEMFAKIKSGERTGLSMFGRARKV